MKINIDNPYKQYMYSYPHKTAYEYTEKKLSVKKYQKYMDVQETSIYFHIPFCETKCGYCNLFSVPNPRESIIEEYINSIKRHSQQLRKEIDFSSTKFKSLVFGGGTPLMLSEEQLEALFDIAEYDFNLNLDEVYTVIETSPNQTTYDMLKYLKSKKVNRISIGVQSFIENELLTLRRFHSTVQAKKAIESIKKVKFESFNIDLIYGIPNQTLETLKYSIEEAISYEPDELFIYPLYQKPNTGIFDKFEIDRNLQYEMYDMITKLLIQLGYHQTSMRRFVRKKEIKEKISCGFENMIALGCGGRSYIGPLHFCEAYTSKKSKVIKLIEKYNNRDNYLNNISHYELNNYEMKRRFFIKNILQCTGLSLTEYHQTFADTVFNDFPLINDFISKKWMIVEINNILKLTDLGLSLSDYIGPMLISDEVEEKMRNYKDE